MNLNSKKHKSGAQTASLVARSTFGSLCRRGALLKYVATYAPKFSDSFAKEWLNDKASDYSIARRVLFDYHPLEPEMWLSLCGKLFPQCSYGGSLVGMVAPWPGMDEKPKVVIAYEACVWRGAGMSLLEFMRKSNEAGQIIRYLKQKHKAAETTESLETFAQKFKPRGEKLIAADTVSRLRDRYYGQWMALNLPFVDLSDFLVKDIVEKVPERYRLFACALHHAPDYWGDEDRIRSDMELEAYGNDHIRTVLSQVKAQRHLVQRYLDGELDPEDVGSANAAAAAAAGGDSSDEGQPERERYEWDSSQKVFKAAIDLRVKSAIDARDASGDEAYETIANECAKRMRVMVGLGPPGTGKTTVVHHCIRRWRRKGARILFALPTGQLASEVRSVHPDIDVDTCHSAFLFHRELTQALPILTQYDLVVVDELSMLSDEQFDRIVAMWYAAEKIPCLVLLGDFWQLPGPHRPPSSAKDSPAWKHVKIYDFVHVHRCKDEVLSAKLQALRTSVPSAKLLKKIANFRHRAWTSKVPTAWDVLELLRKTEDKTTVVTCSRKGAAVVNDLALKVMFEHRHKTVLTEIPFTYEANVDNFDEHGQLKDGVPKPCVTKIFKGLRLFLTKNINKREDFVNGMTAHVEDFDEESGNLEVITKTGKRLCVFKIFERLEGRPGVVAYYPVRVGYAGTVHKIQGQTLQHVTLYLDVPGCPAAGYVALSRVSYDNEYLIAGPVVPRSFTPAH